MKKIRFGMIGAGLMGREFASAVARWCHLKDVPATPELIAVCDTNTELLDWYQQMFPSVTQLTTNYQELLANDQIDAVYVAVPHHLHERIYCDVIKAGKHLMGEKPFGIDQQANAAILDCMKEHPDVLVRCSSEFPFFPVMQHICGMIESHAFGQILEVNAGFLHSSDLDPEKPINWKRIIEFNGEYGVMGDLGLHPCHVPFRAGWMPVNVRGILSNIITERPDGKGGRVACETWDNATLLCLARDEVSRDEFPMTIKTQRIAPGETNTWYLEILGTKAGARFTTKNARRLEVFENQKGVGQTWHQIDMGYQTAFPTITGGIFEFGFCDAIQQMWASFIYELAHGKPINRFVGCVTPRETQLSHRLFTAALESHKTNNTVAV